MADIKAGNSDVDLDDLGHVKGIKQGNATGNYKKQVGHEADGKRTARASTGINAEASEPIDPSMPNLSPG